MNWRILTLTSNRIFRVFRGISVHLVQHLLVVVTYNWDGVVRAPDLLAVLLVARSNTSLSNLVLAFFW